MFPGARVLTFDSRYSAYGTEIKIPCGQCIGCRLAKSRDWALRCVHEASLYEKNCFLTLTYDDEHLPKGGSLNVEDIQKFFKRLRKAYGSHIRYLQCGEYGSRFSRPHHHAVVFNFDFPDKEPFTLVGGNILYISRSLGRLWPYGIHTIGACTYDTCAYVARYVTKKITGDLAEEHYQGRKPEYITMSRRPGIGRGWYEKFKSDLYPKDYVVERGVKLKPAKYYDRLYDIDDHALMQKIKEKRQDELETVASDFTPERLEVKEESLKLAFREHMKRRFESGEK